MSKKYYYDEESDSVLICMKEGKEEKFEEIVPGVNIELDENDEVIGIEILKASRFMKKAEKVAAR